MEHVEHKVRDKDGILHTKTDDVRARDSYSVKGTDFTGTAGVQALTIGTGEKLYIERIIIQENDAQAGSIAIYDGTVADDVPLFQYTLDTSDELDFKELGIKAAIDTDGIFVKTTTCGDIDLTICVKRVSPSKV